MTDIDTRPAELRPVTIKVGPSDETVDVTVTGEMVTDHLAIVPTVNPDGTGYTGYFYLTHIPSGMAVPATASPETLRDLADVLTNDEDLEGVDWSSVNPFPNPDDRRRARIITSDIETRPPEIDVDRVGHLVILDVSSVFAGETDFVLSTDDAIRLAIRLMAAVGHSLDIV